MVDIVVTDIEWDCEDTTERSQLPTSVIMSVDDIDRYTDEMWYDNVIDEISERLSNEYGYTTKGFATDIDEDDF